MSSVLALEQVVLADSFSSSSSREFSLRNPLLGVGCSLTSDISSETVLIDFLDFLFAELLCRAVLLTAPGKNILEIADNDKATSITHLDVPVKNRLSSQTCRHVLSRHYNSMILPHFVRIKHSFVTSKHTLFAQQEVSEVFCQPLATFVLRITATIS